MIPPRGGGGVPADGLEITIAHRRGTLGLGDEVAEAQPLRVLARDAAIGRAHQICSGRDVEHAHPAWQARDELEAEPREQLGGRLVRAERRQRVAAQIARGPQQAQRDVVAAVRGGCEPVR